MIIKQYIQWCSSQKHLIIWPIFNKYNVQHDKTRYHLEVHQSRYSSNPPYRNRRRGVIYLFNAIYSIYTTSYFASSVSMTSLISTLLLSKNVLKRSSNRSIFSWSVRSCSLFWTICDITFCWVVCGPGDVSSPSCSSARDPWAASSSTLLSWSSGISLFLLESCGERREAEKKQIKAKGRQQAVYSFLLLYIQFVKVLVGNKYGGIWLITVA